MGRTRVTEKVDEQWLKSTGNVEICEDFFQLYKKHDVTARSFVASECEDVYKFIQWLLYLVVHGWLVNVKVFTRVVTGRSFVAMFDFDGI